MTTGDAITGSTSTKYTFEQQPWHTIICFPQMLYLASVLGREEGNATETKTWQAEPLQFLAAATAKQLPTQLQAQLPVAEVPRGGFGKEIIALLSLPHHFFSMKRGRGKRIA